MKNIIFLCVLGRKKGKIERKVPIYCLVELKNVMKENKIFKKMYNFELTYTSLSFSLISSFQFKNIDFYALRLRRKIVIPLISFLPLFFPTKNT